MTTAQVVEISATFNYNSPIQDYAHPDNHIPPVYEWILGKTFQYNDNTWQSLTVTVDWLFKLEIKKKNKKNKHLNTGCKESPFHSLPFGQAVASM